ncbi:PEP/pyruvate-binding domain-containing protein, partial [Burkholderia anthina]|uniref:PEP/pyruvate-binding domain-containing protein n=1 Tax=Burkholderia anthina TaxID=179879 RepID=UPI00244642DA
AYVIPFEQLRMTDVEIVGGKNASLGEMISQLSEAGVRVPTGFATTELAFRDFLAHNDLTERIAKRLESLDIDDVKALAVAGAEIRKWMVDAPLQPRREAEIREQFVVLCHSSPEELSFAVRSSATAQDLPDASFAGQQQSYL